MLFITHSSDIGTLHLRENAQQQNINCLWGPDVTRHAGDAALAAAGHNIRLVEGVPYLHTHPQSVQQYELNHGIVSSNPARSTVSHAARQKSAHARSVQ